MKLKCKQCNREIHAYKKTLKPYGYCLNCLPEQYRCRADRTIGGKCHYPKVQGQQTCTKHLPKKRMDRKTGKPGYVYLVSLGFDDLYKIGMAKHPLKRLVALKAANPKAKIRHKVKVDYMKWAERECHVEFASLRKEREIFEIKPESVGNVIRFMNNLNT